MSDIETNLKNLLKNLTDVAKDRLETEAVKSVKKNFEVGGRGAPNTPWTPSKKSKMNAGTKTLVISGHMSDITATTEDTPDGARIILQPGSSAKTYSRIQHEGGKINMPARKFRFRKNKNERTVFAKNSHARITKESMGKPYSITIPPRPYLLIPEEDYEVITNRVRSAIRNIIS